MKLLSFNLKLMNNLLLKMIKKGNAREWMRKVRLILMVNTKKARVVIKLKGNNSQIIQRIGKFLFTLMRMLVMEGKKTL